MDGSSPSFSPGQAAAYDAVQAWLETPAESRKPIFRLFGYAGTGKTTIARHLAANLSDVAFMAYTGKAALQMRRSGCTGATTIHSAIYKVHDEGHGTVTFRLDPEAECGRSDLIVVDECSMVGTEVAKDLLSFGVPILVLGDPAQLPPVKDGGYFTDADPDAMLTEIHRQARENPIIALATAIRQGETGWRRIRQGHDEDGLSIVKRGTLGTGDVLAADQIIVGRNATRDAYNARIRTAIGRASLMPERGDRLVCLRNDRNLGIFNGGIYTCDRVLHQKRKSDCIRLKVRSEDFPSRKAFIVSVRPEFFLGGLEDLDWKDLSKTQQFDYGYALTAHKAQGSQWPSLIVYDESFVFRDKASQWLYTAVTRAEDHLTLVI